MNRRGFTLIELLIVVAIIAILAAIAVPNFLEAQTRSKISRVKADLRTYATALEAYKVDTNQFPTVAPPLVTFPHLASNLALVPLSTPVAYITTSYISDPFDSVSRALPGWTGDPDTYVYANYKWFEKTSKNQRISTARALTWGDWHLFEDADAVGLISWGPSKANNPYDYQLGYWLEGTPESRGQAKNLIYDPTNGTISEGSISRWAGDTRGYPQQP